MDSGNASADVPSRGPAVGALFPIAGIGASAGGLAATIELVRQLGDRPGLGVVIVHHLDPTHESSLVDIFSRATRMPVSAASDGCRVEPNHVYVVPPNAGLVLADGLLNLTPRIEQGGLHLPIDRFFESLAEDRMESAIGVLLSGSGSDGSRGIQAIKAGGGVTFAQDASAEYRSMPDSAMATGCVDFVLPPAAIARELVRIGEHPPAAHGEPSDQEEPAFGRLLVALRRASGIDFANYKHATIRRRAQRRVFLHRKPNLREYVELLEQDPAEASALAEEMLIHVTGFFRDPAVFHALETQVFPKLLEHHAQGAPIRVWVPGCSTGEEVYSLAIGLLEFLVKANRADVPIKIFGTDVSATAIERARAGKYAEGIEQDVSPSRLESFFSKLGGVYQIRKDVRDACVFARHDATRDPPFSGMDLISCRNLLIYLGTALQARTLAILHYALRESGFLVLGSSETIHSSPGFSILDAQSKIYQRTSAAPRLLFDFAAPELRAPVPSTALEPSKAAGPLDVHREADRVVLAKFAPPGMLVNDDLAIVQFRGKTAPYLEPTPGEPSLDLLRMVREELRLPLRQAIDESRAKQRAAHRAGVRLGTAEGAPVVDIEIIPLSLASTEQRFFVVLLRDMTPRPAQPAAATPALAGASTAEPPVVAELRQELAAAREYLESVIERLEASNEELKAANEEITSSNEELRSTNEELQMAKEELQATNQELRTVNDEMVVRNREATRLSDDLTNVLSSVEIPIVLVGRDAKIRRFAPAAAAVLALSGDDIGRPLSEGQRRLAAAGAQMSREVLSQLSPVERTLPDERGHWYQLTARPYLTLDRRIDGAVLTAFDVDAIKKATERLGEAQQYAESIVDTVSECLLVIDAEHRVRSANRAFYRTFRRTPPQVVGRRLDELAAGPEPLPSLEPRLAELLQRQDLEESRLEQAFPDGSTRAFSFGARHIENTSLVLLVLDDVTEKEVAQRALARSESRFREVLTTAAEGIVMTDTAGLIVFANHALTALFGYGADELLGQPIEVLLPERLREHHVVERARYLEAPSPRRMGRDRELVGRRKDGTEVSVEVVLNPVDRESGRLVVCFVTDVSARRAAEQSIRDYQEKLRQMAFDAALAEERERRRIAADLHDQIGQTLALAQMKLKSVPPEGAQHSTIQEAIELLAQSLVDIRTLIFDLSPPILYELGLKDALSWLAEDLAKRSGIHIEVSDDDAKKPLDDATAALVFRAVRELLTNVVKHARAPTAKVSLRRAGELLEIDVEDPGVGFDPDAVARPSVHGGFGLFSVREQISRLGGTLSVESAERQGTRVSLRLPMKAEAPPAHDSERGQALANEGPDPTGTPP